MTTVPTPQRLRYHLSNGYHNTTTSILVAPVVGARVSGRAMRRAMRVLCGMSDCCCGSSPASDPREGQPLDGFADDRYRHLALDTAYTGRIGEDPDECILIDSRID